MLILWHYEVQTWVLLLPTMIPISVGMSKLTWPAWTNLERTELLMTFWAIWYNRLSMIWPTPITTITTPRAKGSIGKPDETFDKTLKESYPVPTCSLREADWIAVDYMKKRKQNQHICHPSMDFFRSLDSRQVISNILEKMMISHHRLDPHCWTPSSYRAHLKVGLVGTLTPSTIAWVRADK